MNILNRSSRRLLTVGLKVFYRIQMGVLDSVEAGYSNSARTRVWLDVSAPYEPLAMATQLFLKEITKRSAHSIFYYRDARQICKI